MYNSHTLANIAGTRSCVQHADACGTCAMSAGTFRLQRIQVLPAASGSCRENLDSPCSVIVDQGRSRVPPSSGARGGFNCRAPTGSGH